MYTSDNHDWPGNEYWKWLGLFAPTPASVQCERCGVWKSLRVSNVCWETKKEADEAETYIIPPKLEVKPCVAK